MCYGFGGWLTEDGKFYFGAPNIYGDCAHSNCIDALKRDGYSDTNAVPIEYPDWTLKSFRVDAVGAPEWMDRRISDVALKRVKPIWRRAEKVFNAVWIAYDHATRIKYWNFNDIGLAEMIVELRKIEGFCEND